jgi:hypothetical protein
MRVSSGLTDPSFPKVEPLDDNFDFTEVSDLVLTARDIRSSDKVVFMNENDPTEQTPDLLTSSSSSSHPFDSILRILERLKSGNLKVRPGDIEQ